MKHKRWWCNVIYKEGCAPCKMRQLRYGFRMDPEGYMRTRAKVWDDPRFTIQEKMWIIAQARPITIEY